jgi:hypothetical protein
MPANFLLQAKAACLQRTYFATPFSETAPRTAAKLHGNQRLLTCHFVKEFVDGSFVFGTHDGGKYAQAGVLAYLRAR